MRTHKVAARTCAVKLRRLLHFIIAKHAVQQHANLDVLFMRQECCWPHDMHGAAHILAADGMVQRAHCDLGSMQYAFHDLL